MGLILTNNNNSGAFQVSGTSGRFSAAPPPRITTSGLRLHLNATSYPGSGSTWTDISGNSKDATLENTPTYVSSNPKYFSFNANTGEKASGPDLGTLSTWTAECWFRVTTTWVSNYVTSLITDRFDGTNKLNFCMGFSQRRYINGELQVGFFDGQWRFTSGFVPVINTWYHAMATYDGSTIRQYNNGTLQSFLDYVGTPQSSGLGYRVAARWDAQGTPYDFFPGDIGAVRIYNRSLTADEVQENFNAERSRFGI